MNGLKAFDLTGKTALVTGVKRGIGRAMAEGLAAAGADIIGVSATLDPTGGAVGAAVESLGRSFHAYRCDFSDRAAVTAFAAQVLADHPVIDILVNNAGKLHRMPAVDHADDLWDDVIEVNLNAQFVLTREVGRSMVVRGSGKVIFTASIMSFQGGVHLPGYAASKGAIAQLTKAFANEWAAQGVNVNAIAPGYVKTEINEVLREDHDRTAAIAERIPAGRWGAPEDMVGPVIFLASSASDYMHGVVMPVDGGWMGR